jgi:hypothetical protein
MSGAIDFAGINAVALSNVFPGWTVRGNEIRRDQFVVEVAA